MTMDIPNNSSDQDKLKAETLENANERSQYFAAQEIQQSSQEAQNRAELTVDVVGKIVDAVQAYSELNTESADLRGQTMPDLGQQAPDYGQVADGLTIAATAGILATQKAAQLLQEKQEADYSQLTEAQLAEQNQVLQEVVKDDRQQQAEYEQEQLAVFEASLEAHQDFGQNHDLDSTQGNDHQLDKQDQVLHEATENDMQQLSEYEQDQLAVFEASLDSKQDFDHSHDANATL